MSWLSCIVFEPPPGVVAGLWRRCFVQRWLRRPALAHVLWILVLVKLITPPLLNLPLAGSPGPLACTLAFAVATNTSDHSPYCATRFPGYC